MESTTDNTTSVPDITNATKTPQKERQIGHFNILLVTSEIASPKPRFTISTDAIITDNAIQTINVLP